MLISNMLMNSVECRVKLYIAGTTFDSARDFYHQGLGLPIRHEWNNEAGEKGVMLDLSKRMVLELIDHGTECPPVAGCDLSIAVADVWCLHGTLEQSGLKPTSLRDREWGDTEFTLADPAGFILTFFSPTVAIPV